MAENLGLAAFAKIIDGMILSHVESRIKQGDKECTELKDDVEKKMSALGVSPSEISLDILKDATRLKLDKLLETVKEQCTSLFDELAPKKNFFDTVEDALLGNVAHGEIKNLVKNCVSMSFEHDTDGEVQLCRFYELRKHYERYAVALVEKRLPDYDKEVHEVLRVMEIVADYSDINGMSSIPAGVRILDKIVILKVLNSEEIPVKYSTLFLDENLLLAK